VISLWSASGRIKKRVDPNRSGKVGQGMFVFDGMIVSGSI